MRGFRGRDGDERVQGGRVIRRKGRRGIGFTWIAELECTKLSGL